MRPPDAALLADAYARAVEFGFAKILGVPPPVGDYPIEELETGALPRVADRDPRELAAEAVFAEANPPRSGDPGEVLAIQRPHPVQ